jgi:hypothetical protein
MTAHRRLGGSRGRRPTRRSVRRAHPAPVALPVEGSAEDLWERHGRPLFTLACVLLGDETAAGQAVTSALAEVRPSSGASPGETRRTLARHVYRSSQAVVGSPRTAQLPPSMVWLGQLAQLQRASLALCVFGGHTHREAAALLGVAPRTVAELLTAGLREIGRLATTSAPRVAPAP